MRYGVYKICESDGTAYLEHIANVEYARYAPDGDDMVIIRFQDGKIVDRESD